MVTLLQQLRLPPLVEDPLPIDLSMKRPASPEVQIIAEVQGARRKPIHQRKSKEKLAALARNRQSARDCRARKQVRIEYLKNIVEHREKVNTFLHNELEALQIWAEQLELAGQPSGPLSKYRYLISITKLHQDHLAAAKVAERKRQESAYRGRQPKFHTLPCGCKYSSPLGAN